MVKKSQIYSVWLFFCLYAILIREDKNFFVNFVVEKSKWVYHQEGIGKKEVIAPESRGCYL